MEKTFLGRHITAEARFNISDFSSFCCAASRRLGGVV
jgi:hypothetical protein